jgi:DNA-binding response OmpR family regulator
MAKTILLLDDDVAVHALVKKVLAPLGVAISDAYDGQEGLAMVNRVKPDLLIVDLSMPRLDGWAFMRKYREATSPAAPVMVLSSRAGFMDKTVRSRLSEVEAYVTKPFDPKGLRTTVKELLSGGDQAKAG